jgi:hypothetical protein
LQPTALIFGVELLAGSFYYVAAAMHY